MKSYQITLFVLAFFLMASCGQQSGRTDGDYYGQEDSYNEQDFNGDAGNYEETAIQQEAPVKHGRNRSFQVVDRNSNIPMWTISLPDGWIFDYSLDYSKNRDYPGTNWKASDRRTSTHAENIRSDIYTYTTDQMSMQSLQMAGIRNTPPAGVNAIQQKVVSEMMAGKGYRKVGESPSKAHVQRTYEAAQKFGISGVKAAAITADWEGVHGKKAQTVLVYASIERQGMTTWWYESMIVEGEGKGFARAADELNSAILAIQDNPAWIQHSRQVAARNNAARQQQAQQSFQAHQQRMADNQRNFEATQRAITGANDAVNNSIMQTYQTQSQSSDRSQSQFIDYMRDERNVYNPDNNTSYKVESGYNQYYMNNSGEYIGTNDAFYNPNMDPAINNQNWTETDPY